MALLDGDGGTVLVVDDSDDVRTLVCPASSAASLSHARRRLRSLRESHSAHEVGEAWVGPQRVEPRVHFK